MAEKEKRMWPSVCCLSIRAGPHSGRGLFEQVQTTLCKPALYFPNANKTTGSQTRPFIHLLSAGIKVCQHSLSASRSDPTARPDYSDALVFHLHADYNGNLSGEGARGRGYN